MTLTEQIRPTELLAAAARTATVTTTARDRQDYGRAQEWVFLLSCGAATGTTPTLNIQIQDSDDGTTFANVTGAAFTQTTAAAFKELTVKNTRRYIRAVCTIAGTTPSFTFALIAVAGEALDQGI